jgi:dTDP-4-dehydrorhamnose 3,5-epimerase
MKVIETELPGVLVIEPKVFEDERGFFFESYHAKRYQEAGVHAQFVQSNYSRSVRGVLRGMHYQLAKPQAKLVQVSSGTVLDIAVDIRRGSPSFGRWVAWELSAENKRQIYIPEGFAHGFYVLSDTADLIYLCSDYYAPAEERGVRWDDPDIGIRWPEGKRIVAAKDQKWPRLKDLEDDLPVYNPQR